MPHRLPGLDLLRAIAIVWVMLFHSFLVGGLGPDWAWLSRFGWAGVDIFFVLSGFLIGTPLLRTLQRGEPLPFAAFYERRAWRILPAFAVVLAVYVLVPSMREAPGLQPWWQFATFTMNLLVDYNRNAAFSHAWSLCVEEHFYLVFPVAAWALTRRPSAGRFIATLAGLVLMGLLLRGLVWWHDAALNPPRNWFVEDLYYPTWMRLDGLLAGVTLAVLRVHRPHWWHRQMARATLGLVAGLAVSALALWLFRERTGLLANVLGWPVLSLGFGLLVLAACSAQGMAGRWHVPGVAWLAGASYSLYLSHKLAYQFVQVHAFPWLAPHRGLQLLACGAAAFVLGAALHHLVERPGLRWRDRRTARVAGRANAVAGGLTTSA